MKFILSLLIFITSIAFSQEKKKITIDEHEFDDIEEEVKFVPPSDAILVPSKGKKVSEWGEEVFVKPPIVEKEWHEPIKEEDIIWDKKPWEIAAEAERANKIDILYKVLSNDENYSSLIGDEVIFKDKMKNPNKVKILYKALLEDEKYANTISNLLLNEEDVKLSNIDSIPNASELVLEENRRLQLDSILKKMAANGESNEDIIFVANDFKAKYGVLKPKTIKTSISNSSTFLKEFKKLALPIFTIIALVILCYRLIRNITVTKIKTVLKSDSANKIYKIAGLTVFVSAIVLWYTNPSLREFKEITPSKLAIEKDNGFCDEEWKLSHTKVKNNIFYSYYKFSFGCSNYNRAREKVELIEYKEYYYIGIFNNFYRVEYP